MRNVKIVADSSANLMELKTVPFDAAPLKIITAQREFVDDRELDLEEMIRYFSTCKDRSRTSCPNTEDWLTAFGDADEVYCVTITSGLSGSYNAACIARDIYEEKYPGRRVYVIDSLSAGPELTLIVEKLEQLICEGKTFDEIRALTPAYLERTGLLFMLESLNNFAANGRVSPAVAKIAGVLGIRIVGKASDVGTLGMKVSPAPQGELSRAGAQLMFALTEASNVRIALIVGNAIGSAYAAMASRAAADAVYAWPGAVISAVTPKIAVQLNCEAELKTADDPQAKRAELEEKYMADVADGVNAAVKGYVDDVIEPAQTRQILAAALEMLSGKRENKPAKKHGNMPL